MRKTSGRRVDGRDERDKKERGQRRALLDGCRGHRPIQTCRPACILCAGPLPVRVLLSMPLGGALPVLAVWSTPPHLADSPPTLSLAPSPQPGRLALTLFYVAPVKLPPSEGAPLQRGTFTACWSPRTPRRRRARAGPHTRFYLICPSWRRTSVSGSRGCRTPSRCRGTRWRRCGR